MVLSSILLYLFGVEVTGMQVDLLVRYFIKFSFRWQMRQLLRSGECF